MPLLIIVLAIIAQMTNSPKLYLISFHRTQESIQCSAAVFHSSCKFPNIIIESPSESASSIAFSQKVWKNIPVIANTIVHTLIKKSENILTVATTL